MIRRMLLWVTVVLGLATVSWGTVMANDVPVLGKIERVDPAFDRLVDTGAVIELLAEKKFEWSEGPVWDAAKRRLLFSDIPRNMIWEWSEAGGLKKFLEPSGYTGAEPFTGREPGSNGLTFNKAGELLKRTRTLLPLTGPQASASANQMTGAVTGRLRCSPFAIG